MCQADAASARARSGIGERTSRRDVRGRLLDAQSVHGYPRQSTRYPLVLLTQAGPACPDLGRVDLCRAPRRARAVDVFMLRAARMSVRAPVPISTSTPCERGPTPLSPLLNWCCRRRSLQCSTWRSNQVGPGLVLTSACPVVLSVSSFCPFGRGAGGGGSVIL